MSNRSIILTDEIWETFKKTPKKGLNVKETTDLLFKLDRKRKIEKLIDGIKN